MTVEHWDNIQPRQGPNASGRRMVDGPVEARDHALTEENRARVRTFVEDVLIAGDLARFGEFVAEGLVQHDAALPDGASLFRDYLGEASGRRYDRLHRVLAEGDFVLAVCRGSQGGGALSSFYHLFRREDRLLAEHWTTVEKVPPTSECKNDNGKF